MKVHSPQLIPTRHDLKAAPRNICVGYFDNQRSPALRVSSGDTVYVETLNHFGDGVSKTTLTDDLVEFRNEQSNMVRIP